MKRWKGLLVVAACVIGSCYVGSVGAMTCNVNYNGQTIKIDTNPGVIDAQEGWSSYSGGTPVCPPYIANSVIASIQAQNQTTYHAERREAMEGEPVGQTGAINAESEANLVRKVHKTINSAIMNHNGNAKMLIDNGIDWEYSKGGVSRKVAEAARQDLYDIYSVN